MKPDKRNYLKLGTDEATLQKQRERAERAIAKKGASPRWDRRLGRITEAQGALQKTAADEAAAKVEADAKAAEEAKGFQVDPETARRLFPTLGQSYDDWYGGMASGYQTRLGQADKAIRDKLAAQGLLGSGRERQLYSDAANTLNAEAQQTYWKNQQGNIDNFMKWYGDNQQLAQNERDSLRNSLTNLLGIAAGQSNMTAGYNAASNQANNTLNQGAKQGQYTMAGSGGGGYSAAPTLDNSGSNSLTVSSVLGKGSQDSNLIMDSLGKLFGGGKLFGKIGWS